MTCPRSHVGDLSPSINRPRTAQITRTLAARDRMAHRVSEKAVRKLLRRLGWTSAAAEQVEMALETGAPNPITAVAPSAATPAAEPAQGADPNLSAFSAGAPAPRSADASSSTRPRLRTDRDQCRSLDSSGDDSTSTSPTCLNMPSRFFRQALSQSKAATGRVDDHAQRLRVLRRKGRRFYAERRRNRAARPALSRRRSAMAIIAAWSSSVAAGRETPLPSRKTSAAAMPVRLLPSMNA